MKANMTLNREKQGANTVDALSDNTVSHQQLIKTHISQYIYIKEKILPEYYNQEHIQFSDFL